MDYGALITRAWQLTWRHRFLWIFGLFAATTVGTCSPNAGGGPGVQFGVDARDVERFLPGLADVLADFMWWIGDLLPFLPFIVAAAALILLLGIAFFVVSLIAQGAMAQATTDLARERGSSLGQAWQAGRRFFWRYLGLWLLLLLVAIGFGLLIAVPVAIGALGFLLGDTPAVPFLIIAALVGLVLLLIGIPLAIATTIVVAYAQRAIVVEDVGPWAALGAGIRLLRVRLGPSLVLWLLSLALGIGAAIALAIVAVVLAIPLGGVAVLLAILIGASPATIAYVAVAFVTFIAAMWLLGAIVNTYFWNLWTLAYLQLRGQTLAREDQG